MLHNYTVYIQRNGRDALEKVKVMRHEIDDMTRFDFNSPVTLNAGDSLILEPAFYEGILCTCVGECKQPCKGGCGCEACRAAYGDQLGSGDY